MSEMVERVALAMQLACEGPEGDFERGDFARPHETYVKCARAAIEAMREPTEEMLLVRCDPLLRLGDPETPRVMQWRNGFWQGMIDEALK